MVVKKFNYYRFFVVLVVFIAIIGGTVYLIKDKKYKETYEYKLLNVGYSQDEIKVINNKLKPNQIDKLLTIKYDKNIISFLNEKYFIFSYLNDYLAYKKKNNKLDYKKIVSIINTKTNIDWFDNEYKTDTSKNELMLVNRLYGLEKTYEPGDIIDIPTKYAYTGKKISKSILDNIIDLISAGSQAGYTFVVSDGYRSYSEQESIYNNFVSVYGSSGADELVAKPGHSEYQTGISFDLKPYNKVIDDVKTNEEYLWLKDNAYKYGFIFRFEEEHKDITQFPTSSWRLRYVGESAASLIYSEKISFEEYYAYFVENTN